MHPFNLPVLATAQYCRFVRKCPCRKRAQIVKGKGAPSVSEKIYTYTHSQKEKKEEKGE